MSIVSSACFPLIDPRVHCCHVGCYNGNLYGTGLHAPGRVALSTCHACYFRCCCFQGNHEKPISFVYFEDL